jgi:hypothetical protein
MTRQRRIIGKDPATRRTSNILIFDEQFKYRGDMFIRHPHESVVDAVVVGAVTVISLSDVAPNGTTVYANTSIKPRRVRINNTSAGPIYLSFTATNAATATSYAITNGTKDEVWVAPNQTLYAVNDAATTNTRVVYVFVDPA